MGIFDDLGVVVEGLDDDAEEYGGNVEEIFRFEVLITPEQEIEIGVTVKELAIEGVPRFGAEYGRLAHTFAQLVVEHVGMNTENFMEAVRDLPALDVKLSEEEKAILAENEDGTRETGSSGSVLLYSFPVLIMEAEEASDGEIDFGDDKQLGVGFERSQKAQVMAKMYGKPFKDAEEFLEDKTTDDILDHGLLFTKAVETVRAE